MSSYKYNIVIDQGADFVATVDVTPWSIDTADYSFTGSMRKHHGADSAVSFTMTKLSSNSIAFSMNVASTTTLDPGFYVYDILATSDANVVSRIVEGMARINPGATLT